MIVREKGANVRPSVAARNNPSGTGLALVESGMGTSSHWRRLSMTGFTITVRGSVSTNALEMVLMVSFLDVYHFDLDPGSRSRQGPPGGGE